MEATNHLLLTGATGFFGKALLSHWAESAPPTQRVTALSRNPHAFALSFPKLAHQTWLQWHAGDIVQPDSLPHHTDFTHILHAAADSTLGPQLTPLQRYDQIINGTRHLLDLAVRCKTQRFLFTSSGGVYGSLPPQMDRVTENWFGMPDPLNPSLAYGVAKRGAEHLCALYRDTYGLETVVARCFAFVGPDLPLDVHFAIGNFIRDALHADSITVQGDGSPLRSYMDQRDLAQWLVTILTRGQFGQAYNVGSDHAVSVLELAHTVRDLLAPHKPVRVISAHNMTGSRNRYIPCVEKAKADLGLRVTIPLVDAILFAASAHRAGNMP